MEVDEPMAADGDEGQTQAGGGPNHKTLDYEEVNDASYLQRLLASNPTFADVLPRDVRSVLLWTDTTTTPDGSNDDDDNNKNHVNAASSTDTGNPSSNSDRMEISLRSHGVRLLNRVLSAGGDDDGKSPSRHHRSTSPALSELGNFWTLSVQLCRHVVHFASRHEKHLHVPAVRKLPFLLLEDVLDGLTLRDAKAFWIQWFVPIHPYLLKMDAGMSTSSSNLVLLKTLNAFWKRCHANTSSSQGDSEWAATVLQTLASSFPLGERSATRVWGSRNLDTLSDFDSSDQYQQHVAAATAAAGAAHPHPPAPDGASSASAEPPAPRIDYSVYQSLWSLQQDFSSPYIKNVGVFLSRVKTVLDALETTTPQLPTNHDGAGGGATVEAALTGKYLTHARLLPYQLQDAEFRAILLTQLLIVADHVSNEAPGVGTQLDDSRQRAVKLLSLTHPELLSALRHILRISEPRWSAWKKNKFPDIDVKPRKRPREGRPSTPTSRSVKRRSDAAPPLLDLRTELPSICAPLQAPTLEEHLVSHEYIDALDPEAGIEDEYHPKSNPYFCWQALRLLPVGVLEKVHYQTGDFETAVRLIWKRDKGIEIPVAQHETIPVAQQEAVVEEEPADSATEAALASQEEEIESQERLLGPESMLDANDTTMEEGEKSNGGSNMADANDSGVKPIEDSPEKFLRDDQETADMDVVIEHPASPASADAGVKGDEAPQKAEEPEANSQNGDHATHGPHLLPVAEKPEADGVANSRSSVSTKSITNKDSTDGKVRSFSTERSSARGEIDAPIRNAPGWSPPPRRENSSSESGLGRDVGGAQGYRFEGPTNRNAKSNVADRPRHPSRPQIQDAGRRGTTDEGHADRGRDGFDGQGRRVGNNRGGDGGAPSIRDERNGGPVVRDGGGRGPPVPSREERGAHRGRDERGPPPGRDERGPNPRRDERGPAPRRDERAGPPPSAGGAPSQSKIVRDDRGSHSIGRRDDRRGPPSVSTDGGRDDRNGPTLGRRDDRWNRGDGGQDRREGGGGSGGGQRRGTSHDGSRPRR